ncbi:DNA topoisomerase 2-like [Vicia villosa]|uniref:DNA topoisomerase 2-like n=1 Tax=Vicia villosa TaxID=3911 RepID=UPI00273ADC09|nr:DNA topoisomerase 2-like [Vicia villosa]
MEQEIFVKTLSKRSISKLKVKTNDTIMKIKNRVVNELTPANKQEYMIFFNNEYKPLSSIEKLEDAKFAGTDKSHLCTLILTEGDSAKEFVMSGLSSIINSEDIYGVFPLKGKIPNVRGRWFKLNDMINNEEIQSFVTILGLRKKEDNNYKFGSGSLRYGQVMIISDPISKSGTKQSFYFHQEYESWKKTCKDPSSWEISYYKGLSTNTPEEALEYFQNIEDYKKYFIWKNEDDHAIDIPFDPKNISGRKEWIRSFKPENPKRYLKTKTPSYAEFIHSELILYSIDNIQRKIPSLVDGLNKVQRKILFSLLQREEMKLDYVNSNNINLLLPLGHFGSSKLRGKDHAAYRYTRTQLNSITRYIFLKDDDMFLDYLNEDGESVEPYCYRPIIPIILVNGCVALSVGWSSYVPKYHPRDIIENIKSWLKDRTISEMTPWYKGFNGAIIKDNSNNTENNSNNTKKTSFLVSGKVIITGSNDFLIKDIPFTRWSTKDYKNFLTSLTKGPLGKTPRIKREKVAKLERDKKSLYYKIVFIELLNMKKNSPLTTFMKKNELLSIFKKKLSEKKEQGEHTYQEEHNHDDVYNFVKSMPIGTLFDDDDDSLKNMKDELKRMTEEIEILEYTTPETLWLNDLEHFESIAKNLLPEVYTPRGNED